MIETVRNRKHSFVTYATCGASQGISRSLLCDALARKKPGSSKMSASLKSRPGGKSLGPVGLATTTISFNTNPANAYYTLPKYVVGLKCYSPRQAQYWPDQVTTTVDGLTYRQMFADMKLDMLCATDTDHSFVTPGQATSAWGAVRDMNFWLADLTGCGASPHFIINHIAAGNSGYVGTFVNDGAVNAPATSSIDAALIGNQYSPIGLYQGGANHTLAGNTPPAGSNNLKQYIDHFNGDLTRIPTIELCNEPSTMTQAQLGQSNAWYRTDSNANERFLANQIRRYAAGAGSFEALYPGTGVKVAGGALAIGADPVFHTSDNQGGSNNAPGLVNQYINGYNDFGSGWRWGAVSGSRTGAPPDQVGMNGPSNFVSADPNTAHVKLFSTHPYNTAASMLATGATGAIQDTLNGQFYEYLDQNGARTSGSAVITGLGSTATFRAGQKVEGTGIAVGATVLTVNSGTSITMSANATSTGTSNVRIYDGNALVTVSSSPQNYTTSKGGYKYAQKKWRAMVDAAPNSSDVKFIGTEQWPWSSNAHDGKEAISDLAMFVAAMEMAGDIKLHAYFFAGGMVSASADAAFGGAPAGAGALSPNDAHFSVYGGFFRRVTRYWSIRDFASRVNFNGPKNLCPMTVVDAIGPAGSNGNGIVSTRGFSAVSTDGLVQEVVLLNTNCSTQRVVDLTWDRTVSTITNGKALDITTPFDTPASNVTITPTSGTTATVTLPPGGALGFRVTFGTTPTPTVPLNLNLPVITGTPQVGQVLTDTNADTWTGSPSSYVRAWQRDNNGGGVWGDIPSATGTTYTLVTADLNCQIRLKKIAHNAQGDSLPAYSNLSGLIAPAGTTTEFGRHVIGIQKGSFGRPYMTGSIFPAGSTGSITSLWIYVGGNAGGTSLLRAIVYNASGTTPGTLVAAGAEVVIQQGQAAGWVQLPINAPVTSGASYLLGAWSGGATNPDWYYDDGTLPTDGHYVQMTPYDQTANPTSPWPVNNIEQRLWSIYATVAPSGGTPPPSNTVAPAITGNALEGQNLTCSSGTWSDGSITKLWFRETAVGSGIYTTTGVTTNTYTVLGSDHGLMIRCAVTATGVGGPTTINAAAVGPAIGIPTNATPPAISGNLIDGQLLTAISDAWNHMPLTSRTWQWYRVDSDGVSNLTSIGGATSQTYLLGTLDIGKKMIVKMTATNPAGTSSPVVASATSAVVAPVTAANFDLLAETFADPLNGANWTSRTDGTSTISVVGGVLTMTLGSASGDITEVARTEFRSLAGSHIHVELPSSGNQANLAVYQWVQFWLDANNVLGVFVNGASIRPWATVNGTFQWLAAAQPFSGGWFKAVEAGGTTTLLRSPDYDSLLTTPVTLWTGTNPIPVTRLKLQLGVQSGGAGSGVAQFDSVNTIPSPINLTAPTLSARQPRVGVAVICDPGTWLHMDGVGAFFTYQWMEGPTQDGPFTPIDGAITSRYIPIRKDANLWLECVVTPHNQGTN